ncbi:MAG: hypothetical protein NC310_01200 [Roseburia sp.]|nr:hypothetical protein [Anaeroplasma bactoclasticum]MCM1195670.1 hypothetical protein [Roseburia sp.]MCM1556127.1 hypothetical protein [Anaeroplasma bactoclasticum]
MGKIDQYIKLKKTVSIPEVQKESGLNYRLIHTLFMRLLKNGQLKKVDELYYTYIRSEEDPLYIYALWLCIKENQFSIRFLQQRLFIDENTAKKIESWLTKNKYVTSNRFSKEFISKEKFLNLYGPLDWDENDLKAFDTWTIEGVKDLERRQANLLFTCEEYLQVAQALIQSNIEATKEEFIHVIENQYQEHQKDKKMMAILLRMMETIVVMDNQRFTLYKFGFILSK